jgi:hypothetical protein
MTPRLVLGRCTVQRSPILALLFSVCACADPVSTEEVTSRTAEAGDADAGHSDGDEGDGDGDQDDGDQGDGDQGDGDGDAGDGDDIGDGDGDAWGEPDAATDDDAGDPNGWDPVVDGGVKDPPDPERDGGPLPGDCRTLANNTNSGSFGTTGAVCFTLEQQPATAWEAYFMDGRTITINGTEVSKGQMPFPGSAPYIVEFSAGMFDYASWAYW